MLFTVLIGGLAVSFSSSGRLQLDVSRDVAAELHSDLAAQSGLEFSQRQLLLDPAWDGTGGLYLTVGDGFQFLVGRSDAGGVSSFQVDGVSGTSSSSLEASLDRDGGNGLGDQAVVFLGRVFDAAHIHLHDGGMLMADQLGVIDDWVNFPSGGGAWQPGGPASLGGIDMKHFHIWDGSLYHYAEADYRLKRGEQVRTTERVQMPAWDLSQWAVPGSGKMIFTHQNHIAHLHTPDTVVVVSDPGAEIHIENSHIDGGVVIWCENTWDLRDSTRNRVKIENCHIGDGGVPHVGVLGPAAEIELENCHVSGLGFVRSYKELENNQMTGQLIVVDTFYLENDHVYFDVNVVNDPPPGINYPNTGGSVSISGIREVYQ